ncbi:PDDEXK nuclease domain-containing protein [Acidovorax temperans]|jgi:predicted nuclease of restriction endonuclease-like (RecB) superfamily
MTALAHHTDYRQGLEDIKRRIQSAQTRAVLAANTELLQLYWDIGRQLAQWQKERDWGTAVVEQMATDLQSAYPGIKGFSRPSLFAMRQFYAFLSPRFGQFEFVSQPVRQIPWGHIRTLLVKVKSVDEALLYAQACVDNGWSRSVLTLQIEQRYHERIGQAASNFAKALPAPQSELVQQSLKDPYVFDFLTLQADAVERDIENQLVAHITRFLLELGKGFAFLGRQYALQVNGRDYFLDLLFYHARLKCYVVIELKAGAFKPEYVGKLNFYLSAVDDLLRTEGDQPTIGLILCKDKDHLDVEYALRDIHKPMGVSSFITKDIPLDVQSQLPSVQEIEDELKALGHGDEGAVE